MLIQIDYANRMDEAFHREKQVQGWSRKKKEALMNGQYDKLPGRSRNYAQFGTSASSVPGRNPVAEPVEATGNENKDSDD